MKDKIKTILKYGVILAIIVGIGFGVKAIFFPTPKPDDAYNNLTSIIENETYKELVNANNQLINLVDNASTPQDKSQIRGKLETINIVFTGLEKITDNYQFCLINAQNNSLYNKNTRKIKKEVKNLNKTLEKAKTYLKDYYNPFYSETSNPSFDTIKTYADVICDYNIEVANRYINVVEYCQTISKNLKQTYFNNDYTRAKSDVVIAWTNLYLDKINERFIALENGSHYLQCCSCVNNINAINYYKNPEIGYQCVQNNIIISVLENYNTAQWSVYYDALSDSEKQTVNQITDFIAYA